MSAALPTPPRDAAPRVEKPAYYAEGRIVWKAPIQHDKRDGSTTVTIGFQACKATDVVGEEGATAIAALLCLGEQHPDLLMQRDAAVEALRAMVALFDPLNGDPWSDSHDEIMAALARADAALSQIQES